VRTDGPHTHLFPLRQALAALLTLAACGAGADASIQPSPEAIEGLTALHQGRFEAASAAFAEISRKKPDDPEGPFFEAFVLWWELLDHPKNEGAQREFETRLQEGIRRGEAMIGGADPVRGGLFAGTANLLSAQSRAFSHSYLSAGSAARQGYRQLEASLAADPKAMDAWFALGAYKYFAARMPWLVRALSVFLRVPAGDAVGGLDGLRRVAAGGSYFRVEASLLLAHIHSDQADDEDLRAALDDVAAARALSPSSPLFAAIEARLQYSLGHLGAAERLARESIALSREGPRVAPTIPVLARLRLALALYYQYRPEEAAAELRPLLSPDADLPEGTPGPVGSLAARLRVQLADATLVLAPAVSASDGVPDPAPPRPTAAAPAPLDAAAAFTRLRGGEPTPAIESLSAAIAKDPDDPIARYHLARALDAAGRRDESVAALTKSLEAGPRLPRALQGWAMIRLGIALESEGKRKEAEAWYQRAGELKGFPFRRAALDRLKNPSDQAPPEG